MIIIIVYQLALLTLLKKAFSKKKLFPKKEKKIKTFLKKLFTKNTFMRKTTIINCMSESDFLIINND